MHGADYFGRWCKGGAKFARTILVWLTELADAAAAAEKCILRGAADRNVEGNSRFAEPTTPQGICEILM